MSDSWRNRIVDKGMETPTELKAHPNNWRVHTDDQRASLEALLDDVGWVREVFVNRTTGNIVDGHLRVARAIARNQEGVPVSCVELTPEEEQLTLATLDPMAAMAQTSRQKLSTLMATLTIPTTALRKRLQTMSVHAKPGAADPDTVPALRDTEQRRGSSHVRRRCVCRKPWGDSLRFNQFGAGGTPTTARPWSCSGCLRQACETCQVSTNGPGSPTETTTYRDCD